VDSIVLIIDDQIDDSDPFVTYLRIRGLAPEQLRERTGLTANQFLTREGLSTW
jgi:hypothetical protein